jgi:hypothetical protein
MPQDREDLSEHVMMHTCPSCGAYEPVISSLRHVAGQTIPTPSSISSLSSAAQSAYQDQLQRMSDLLKQQQMQASGTASQAGQEVSDTAGSAAMLVFLGLFAVAAALVLTRGAK